MQDDPDSFDSQVFKGEEEFNSNEDSQREDDSNLNFDKYITDINNPKTLAQISTKDGNPLLRKLTQNVHNKLTIEMKMQAARNYLIQKNELIQNIPSEIIPPENNTTNFIHQTNNPFEVSATEEVPKLLFANRGQTSDPRVAE